MLGCVGEGGGVLRCCVLWPMGGGVTDHHHHWPVRVDFLGSAEVTDAVVGYQVCQIVLRKEGGRGVIHGLCLKWHRLVHACCYTLLRNI